MLVLVYSCNGNFLLNVGPNHDGRVMPIFEERLLDIGMLLRDRGLLDTYMAVEEHSYMNSVLTPYPCVAVWSF